MLDRTLSLTDLTLFGVASIMGSGGFNLIGPAVRDGGSWWPAALGISAVLLMGSAYTYSSAYDRFKNNTSESEMIRSVFGPLAEGIGASAILIYNLVSIVVILVFCSKMILPEGSWFSQISLSISFLASMTGLALMGIDFDASLISGLTYALIAVLVLAASMSLMAHKGLGPLTAPSHTSFMNSLWLFFFVMVGFDALMKFAEETKDPRDIPRAFYLSNLVSMLLTAGVAFAITMILPNLTKAKAGSAIELLFASAMGKWVLEPAKWIILIFLLLTTFVVFLATTRYLYGLSPLMKEINAAKVPWVAVLSVFGTGSAVSLLNNTELLVKITDLGFAVIATLVAGAVSVADWNEGKVESALISGLTGMGFLGLLAAA